MAKIVTSYRTRNLTAYVFVAKSDDGFTPMRDPVTNALVKAYGGMKMLKVAGNEKQNNVRLLPYPNGYEFFKVNAQAAMAEQNDVLRAAAKANPEDAEAILAGILNWDELGSDAKETAEVQKMAILEQVEAWGAAYGKGAGQTVTFLPPAGEEGIQHPILGNIAWAIDELTLILPKTLVIPGSTLQVSAVAPKVKMPGAIAPAGTSGGGVFEALRKKREEAKQAKPDAVPAPVS